MSRFCISSILDRSESHPRLWNFAVGNRMHRLPIFLRNASLWIFLHPQPSSSSPISRFRSQFSADLFARHAYSSLKLFALSTFSPCTLIHRFTFRNGFARETSSRSECAYLPGCVNRLLYPCLLVLGIFFFFTRFKLRDDYFFFQFLILFLIVSFVCLFIYFWRWSESSNFPFLKNFNLKNIRVK